MIGRELHRFDPSSLSHDPVDKITRIISIVG